MERIVTTKPIVGICHMQVCAEKDITDEEILAFCNRDNPSGTTHGWCQVIRTGDSKPVSCNDDKTRKHFMINC